MAKGLLALAVLAAAAEGAQVPNLLRDNDASHNMILGTLGPCLGEEYHGYHGYINATEKYYCSMGDREWAWKQANYPNVDMCDFGFGELVPAPRTVNGATVYLPTVQQLPGSAESQTALASMMSGGNTIPQAHGSTTGQLIATANSLSYPTQTYQYPTAFAIWKIQSGLTALVQNWRETHHRVAIDYAVQNHYYYGWLRKVVRCSDIPADITSLGAAHLNPVQPMGPNGEAQMTYVLNTWMSMTNVMDVSNWTASFTGPPPDWGAGGPNVSLVNVTADISSDSSSVTISIQGPDSMWFAVGFNAQAMTDLPYAIIVKLDGTVEERKMANRASGTVLTNSLTIQSNVVNNGQRSITLTRARVAAVADSYTFTGAGNLNYIWSIGTTTAFAGHLTTSRGTAQMTVTATAPSTGLASASVPSARPWGHVPLLVFAALSLLRG